MTHTADIWGAGAPLATALAAALRRRGVDATCVDTVGGRLGGPAPALLFPVFDGRDGEETRLRRERLLRDAMRLAAALTDGQVARVIVLSATAAYGSGLAALTEDSPLAAVEGGTCGADARAVEAVLGGRAGVDVLRVAELLGPGSEAGLLARHLAGPRLLLVRGTAPTWQVCHAEDLAAAVALLLGHPPGALGGPGVVASRGLLSEAALEQASGRRRLELPLVVAEATAARLHRTRLSPGAGDELPFLIGPPVVEGTRLAALGFHAGYDAAGAVRAHLAGHADPAPEGASEGEVAAPGTDPAGGRPQAVRLAGATVAAVGSAALLRRARRSRGR